jgi:enediyne biosynthesis protein E4
VNLASACRSQARRVAGIVIIGAAYVAAAPRPPDDADVARLAARYTFAARPLAAPLADRGRSLRPVHPDYEPISAWISSVGAGVALGDFDGDGVDNDACLVDPRADEPVVMPVPGTGARYTPITLERPASPEPPRTIAPMGCIFADLDEDGATDALVYYWGRVPAAFLRRGGSMVASDIAAPARWFSNAGLVTDIDGDGHLDIVIGNYFPDGARVLDPGAREPAAMQDSMSRAYNAGAKHFLLWQGARGDRVQYRDADPGLPEDVVHGWTLALGARDLDGDLRPELYVANDFGPDRLLRNESRPGALRFQLVEGRRGFTTPRSKVLGRDSFKGMGIAFGDIDRDGDDDLAVSNIAAPWMLLESNFLFVDERAPGAPLDGAALVDRSEPLGTARGGWAWDVRFGDFDGDGWLELVQANGFVKGSVNRWAELQELATANDVFLGKPGAWPHFRPGDDLSGHQRNMFFARAGRGRFVDVGAELGLAPDDVSRGLATGDIDGDGDLDLIVANQWEDSQVLVNEAPRQGAALWLRLQLAPATEVARGARAAGSPAIGAVATVTLPDGTRLSQELDGGSGHSGKSAPVVHFGLGDAPPDRALPVKIRYRDRGGVVRELDASVTPGAWTISLAARTALADGGLR